MMSGIQEELHLANKQGLITSGHSNADREKQAIESLISHQCDALILHVEAISDDYLIALSQRKIPFVLLNRYIEDIADQCIVLDDYHGGYIATRLLLDYGHRDIAYITGPKWKVDSSLRYGGHKKAISEHDIEFDSDLIFEGDFTKDSGIEAAKKLLKQGKPFSAVVCGNDEMAAGALGYIRDSNISIPNDVSVIGYDDINVANYLYPRLTTVRYPIGEMASMAAKWVLKNVYQQDVQVINTFTPSLVLRDSCAPRKIH